MLYYSTVSPNLKEALAELSNSDIFKAFRLVGGTAMSLQLGHRMSIDIDMFTDAPYGSIDFEEIEKYLKETFSFVVISSELTSMGKSYFIGKSRDEAVKLDIFYSDPFIREALLEDGIQMTHLDDIVAMKMEVIQNGGRKKDFWDLHELLEIYTIKEMIALHEQRYPYGHDKEVIVSNLNNFESADEDLDVICLRGKYWEVIKADFDIIANNLSNVFNQKR